MSPIKLLEDALAEGRSFADLAGKLRDKFKSGTADLQAIFDEAEGVVDGAIAKARDGLAAFKAEVGASIPNPTGEKFDDFLERVAKEDAAAQPPKPAEPVTAAADVQSDGMVVLTTSPTGAAIKVDAAAGATTHTDTAGVTTTLDHATGAATATDAGGAPIEPHEDAVAEASIATAIAGVTVQNAG